MKIAIVGAGLYGATICALLGTDHDVTVFEAEPVVGGNIRTVYHKEVGCHASEFGAHIFHTNSDRIWDFVTRHADWEPYRHYVKGHIGNGTLIDLPFGMAIFNQVLGLTTPQQAHQYFDRLHAESKGKPQDSVRDWCKANIGQALYETVVKDYTEKQWGRPCSELPASIVQRLPIRFTYDNTYFHSAKYQAMPVQGYSRLVESMLEHATEVKTGQEINLQALIGLSQTHDRVFFSGPLDALFDYRFGALAYRGLRFDHELHWTEWAQGAPVVNELTPQPWTRTIEHKMFYPQTRSQVSLLTREFPAAWKPGDRAYYPIRDQDSLALYGKYEDLASKISGLRVGGRLGGFQYFDMDQVVGQAMSHAKELT